MGDLSITEFIKLVGREPDVPLAQYSKGPNGIYFSTIFASLFPNENQSKPQLISNREFLTSWGVLNWPDKRIIKFIEALVSPTVRRTTEQRMWVDILSNILRPDGFSLEINDYISGQPVYKVIRLGIGTSVKPKNVIFASNGPKPELGLSDAIHNDIMILNHAESCLVYDDPIGDDGVLWKELVQWWKKENAFSSRELAATHLGNRLIESMDSEPEKLFFATYFRKLKPLLEERLPALFPQVYLHYDPKTISQLSNGKRLARQRMDFLLLLPQRTRIVIEIDGKQHYSDDQGMSSPGRYAEMVREDRNLRLLGYEVYRFGGAEFISTEQAQISITSFFKQLFEKYELLKK